MCLVRIQESIRKVNTLRGFKKDLRNLYKFLLKIKRKWFIKSYLATHSITKLHLGSNKTLLNGWLCSDLMPQNNQSIFIDVTQKFPFDDNTFDYVYSEHLLEHLSQEEGLLMLMECFRVLKKNGRLRLATPDLDVVLRLYTERNKNFGVEYIKWSIDNFSINSIDYNPVMVLNTLFHNWGHKFLYDFDFLKDTLEKCGFDYVERFSVSQSKDTNFQNIERHHENIGNFEMTEFETLVVEADKS